jgi:hypothetical protein
MRAICLDGPLNGLYAELSEAADAGYVLTEWPSGEPVFTLRATESAAPDFADPIGETADEVWT